MSNDTAGNAIYAYNRGPKGELSSPTAYATGGNGSGGGLGNQGALVLTENRNFLLAVNAGSNSVSAFRVRNGGLTLTDVEDSQGNIPISIAVDGNLVYVLNDDPEGGNIAGFVLDRQGDLLPLPYSVRPLSLPNGNANAAQIAFSPDGNFLVVTEKATNLITVYPVGDNGLAGHPVSTPSASPTPFGFSFARNGNLFVSEANGGAPDASFASSYAINEDGTLEALASSVSTTETAACWLVLARFDKFAYVTNTGSNTVSGYKVGRDGSLELLDADGVTANVGRGPIDIAVSNNQRFIYTLNGADDSITALQINFDGSLTYLQTVDGVPAAANGLVGF